ncbi:hypothetical protein [Mucilaginibacter sp. PAMB04168]|uniref:hypothetical protein n=1 Tax=Mucilaginibacter sp. PAMB04168 TaxID=3138567 RepID=UPI0031F6808B
MRYLLYTSALLMMACKPSSDSSQAQNQPFDSVKHVDTESVKPVPADRLIVPGKSVGRTVLNDNGAEVVKRLGRPDAGDAAMGKAVSIWYANHDSTAHQTMIYTARQMGTSDETARVKQIRITSPWFTTADSVRTGVPLQQIKQHYELTKAAYYTKGKKQFTLYTTTRGITFEIDSYSNCSAIIIGEPQDKTGSLYLPFYENLQIIK